MATFIKVEGEPLAVVPGEHVVVFVDRQGKVKAIEKVETLPEPGRLAWSFEAAEEGGDAPREGT